MFDIELQILCVYVTVSPDELSNDMKNHGYPRKHRHKLCCLRQELVDAFVE